MKTNKSEQDKPSKPIEGKSSGKDTRNRYSCRDPTLLIVNIFKFGQTL